MKTASIADTNCLIHVHTWPLAPELPPSCQLCCASAVFLLWLLPCHHRLPSNSKLFHHRVQRFTWDLQLPQSASRVISACGTPATCNRRSCWPAMCKRRQPCKTKSLAVWHATGTHLNKRALAAKRHGLQVALGKLHANVSCCSIHSSPDDPLYSHLHTWSKPEFCKVYVSRWPLEMPAADHTTQCATCICDFMMTPLRR